MVLTVGRYADFSVVEGMFSNHWDNVHVVK